MDQDRWLRQHEIITLQGEELEKSQRDVGSRSCDLSQALSYLTHEDTANLLGRDRNAMQIRWSKTGCRGYEITNLEAKRKRNAKEDF
jgi:hypothetical protein